MNRSKKLLLIKYKDRRIVSQDNISPEDGWYDQKRKRVGIVLEGSDQSLRSGVEVNLKRVIFKYSAQPDTKLPGPTLIVLLIGNSLFLDVHEQGF